MTRTMLSIAAGAALLAAVGAAQAQSSPQGQVQPGQAQPGAGMPMMDAEQLMRMMQMMRQGGPGAGPGMGPGMMDEDDRPGWRPGWRHDGPGMMRGDMMGRGMMGRGMERGPMLRIMFAIMDANGDDSLSLEEVQEFHARIFRAIDADDDGGVTQAELRGFMTGAPADEGDGAQ